MSRGPRSGRVCERTGARGLALKHHRMARDGTVIDSQVAGDVTEVMLSVCLEME